MKENLPVLDGLRGVAALCVVVFHMAELAQPDPFKQWISHAYLAVDFFFCLSGYIVAYAYDARREATGLKRFLTLRAIRLHPLVLLGTLFGLAAYSLDPFTSKQSASGGLLASAVLGGMLLFPTWTLPQRWGSYIPLNPPAWSLFWEYIANLAYGLILWRMPSRILAPFTGLFAIAIVVSLYLNGGLSLGWSWENMLYAPIRVGFSFSMGILLFRLGARVRSPLGFTALGLVLIGIFIFPYTRLNWIYEAAVIIIAFPLIVAVGAGADEGRVARNLCALSGRLSYPLYMLHYPFVSLFANYHWNRGIPEPYIPAVIAVFTMGAVATSYLALILFDEPLRHALKTRFSLPLRSSGASSAGRDELQSAEDRLPSATPHPADR